MHGLALWLKKEHSAGIVMAKRRLASCLLGQGVQTESPVALQLVVRTGDSVVSERRCRLHLRSTEVLRNGRGRSPMQHTGQLIAQCRRMCSRTVHTNHANQPLPPLPSKSPHASSKLLPPPEALDHFAKINRTFSPRPIVTAHPFSHSSYVSSCKYSESQSRKSYGSRYSVMRLLRGSRRTRRGIMNV